MRVYGSKVLVSGLGIEHIHVKKGHADGVHNGETVYAEKIFPACSYGYPELNPVL
jgi:hypothetical protein